MIRLIRTLCPVIGCLLFLGAWIMPISAQNDTFLIARLPNPEACANPANPIVAENCQPGTDEWITQNPIGDIYGYASADSVNKGDSIAFFVSSAAPFDILVYRNGFYGGLGGRLVQTINDVPGGQQPTCWHDPANTGLETCSNWSVSYTLVVPETWVSGAYIARVVRQDTGGDNYILFVVRDDDSNAPILYQQSVSTFQAYNNYGGKSTYSSSSGFCNTVADAPRAVKVSHNRPYNQAMSDPNSYFRAEYPMVHWLEAQGYDVTYSTTSDSHRSGKPNAHNELLDHQVFLSVGHDEYWSQEMRDAITSARDSGVHLGFFTANTSYWRIRYEPDPVSGEPDSVMVTYKTTESGPPDPSGIPTGTWRDPAGANNPENGILGIMYVGDNDLMYFPLRITAEQAKHPVFRHTGLESLPPDTYINIYDKLYGWEWDGVVDNGKTPTNLEILADTPVYGMLLQDAGDFANGNLGRTSANFVRYQAASGALVYNVGTIQWSWGLGANGVIPVEPDRFISQITYNVLADMGVQPASPDGMFIMDGSDTVLPELDPADIYSLDEAVGPTISNIKTQVDGDDVVISWETDVEATGQVWLGVRPDHIIFPMDINKDYSRNHEFILRDLSLPRSFKIGNLEDAPTRYLKVVSVARTGIATISEEGRFDLALPALSEQMSNLTRRIGRTARCLVESNPPLWIGVAAVGALIVLTAVGLLGRALIRRRRAAA